MTVPDWYQWDASQQVLTFFGKPATLFWQDPSLASILSPLREELGEAYFFLLIAYSASQDCRKDYHQMVTELADNFQEGLQKWGDTVATAGWGQMVQVEVNDKAQSGCIKVKNPWELALFPDSKAQYALPFICGKLSGLFSTRFSRPMRARVKQVNHFNNTHTAEIEVTPSDCTLRSELQQLTKQEGFTREEKLQFLNKQLQQKAQELEAANRRLQELATQDDLTGLFNRRHFIELAQREFNVCRRYRYPSSLVMFDLDFFKQVNDEYGHLAGDLVLKEVAEVCKSIFRKSDLCGRIGGEEFLIMLPHTDIDGAMIITERLATLINRRIVHYNDQIIKVTISAGVSQIKTEDKQLDDWIKRVDDLMYLAKRRGRNQVVSTE